jgi:hypothetical protein
MCLLFCLLLSAKMARAESLCSTLVPCQAYQGEMISLEIPASIKAEFARNGTSVVVPLPERTCVYKGQEIYLHIRGPQDQMILWGRGRVGDLRTSSTENTVMVNSQALVTDDVLAPTCLGACTAVVDRLPAASAERVLIDLRRRRDLLLEIPNAVSVPMPSPTQFPWAKFPNQSLSYYLIPESPKLGESGVLPLMREMRRRGYNKVFWYHPGTLGLMGIQSPPDPPAQMRRIEIADLKKLQARGARMIYVGLKADFQNLKKPPLPSVTAFFREKIARTMDPANPFERGIAFKNFDFELKSLTRRTPIVLYDRDANNYFKYLAAQALRSRGYNEIYILPSGLLGLIESGPL